MKMLKGMNGASLKDQIKNEIYEVNWRQDQQKISDREWSKMV